jgi:hypothetical protein
MVGPNDGDRHAESRRILDRVAREEQADLGLVGRNANRARGHLSATDADQNDRIEVWGTRIGRAIGILVIVAFCVWLVVYLTSGA